MGQRLACVDFRVSDYQILVDSLSPNAIAQVLTASGDARPT